MHKQDKDGGQGKRQQSQQNDHRPQQDRDLQRNKQSDRGQSGGTEQNERQQSQQNVYGEGNYAASRQYNDATRDFAQSGRVDEAARKAAPRSEASMPAW